MTYIYYIPHSSFFSKHPYGRVAHAIGVANGIAENGYDVILYAESGVEFFNNRFHQNVTLKSIKRFSFFAHFLFIVNTPFIINKLNCKCVFLYRKTILSLFLIPIFHLINIFNKPIVISEVNGFIFDYKNGFSNNLLVKFTELIHKIILRFDNRIYTVNDDLKRILSTGAFAVENSKIICIHNGGPSPSFLNFSGINKHKIKLIFFGILADYNEVELFVDVLNRPSLKGKVELEIIGFGSELESITRYCKNRNDITIHGKMNFEDFSILVYNWKCMMIGIVPMKMGNKLGSLSPIKAFDYMSFGFPLIYSDLCLDGIVEHGIHGYQYQNGNIDSLESSILDIINYDNFMRVSDNVKADYYKHTWKERMRFLITSITE